MAPATSHFVTPDNAAHYRDFLTALRADLQELIAMTRRYPVEVEFGEIRFVFVSEAEVLYCIE